MYEAPIKLITLTKQNENYDYVAMCKEKEKRVAISAAS